MGKFKTKRNLTGRQADIRARSIRRNSIHASPMSRLYAQGFERRRKMSGRRQ
ncbi:hypothetical protein PHMEG_00023626 [Phytophthora megakarya]|uniref:Uncharacterized protein n=1 Tax=Phytophthora megakarya TaxID=4795 RepID=A0A225VIV3_9STRA|nr:hypothetical protein PHMEG_00023626 [Phytophthora megakarya]